MVSAEALQSRLYQTHRVLLALLFLFFASRAIAQPESVRDAEPAYRVEMEEVERSVVRVVVVAVASDGLFHVYQTGSGFVVAPGIVVTNNHVVSEAVEDPNTYFVAVVPPLGEPGEALDATPMARWIDADLAVIEVPGLALPALPISLQRPRKDASVRAAGYPGAPDKAFGLTELDLLQPMEPDSNPGHISRAMTVRRGDFQWPLYTHDASISSGDSGGPLVDSCGRVIGVNVLVLTGEMNVDGRVLTPEGQNYAIRSELLPNILDHKNVRWTRDDATCLDMTAPATPTVTPTPEPPRPPSPAPDPTTLDLVLGGVFLMGMAAGAIALLRWSYGAWIGAAPETRRRLLVSGGMLGIGALVYAGVVDGDDEIEEAQSAGTLSCSSDTLGKTDFFFDPSMACVNNRTPYRNTADGYERVLISGKRLARLRIDKERSQFTSEYWDLAPDELANIRYTSDAIGKVDCPGDDDQHSRVQDRIERFSEAVATILDKPSNEMVRFSCQHTEKR